MTASTPTDVSFQEHVRDLQRRATRGARGAYIGAGAGVALAFIGLLLLDLLPTSGSSEDVSQLTWALLETAAAGCVGAGLGHFIAGRGLTATLTSELGYGAEARLIKDEVRGKRPDLDEAQQRRAARYAAIAGTVLPGQTIRLLALWIGILLNQAAQLADIYASHRSGPENGLSVVSIVFMVALVGFWTFQFRTVRQARTYSRNHPVV